MFDVRRSTKDFFGNICSHIFTLALLRKITSQPLPHHVVHKKIKHVTGADGTVSKAMGIKLERFIFDVFERATTVTTLLVPRASEFAPVKNAQGPDSPQTARELVTAAAKAQLKHARLDVPQTTNVEISPLVSYRGELLVESMATVYKSGSPSFAAGSTLERVRRL